MMEQNISGSLPFRILSQPIELALIPPREGSSHKGVFVFKQPFCTQKGPYTEIPGPKSRANKYLATCVVLLTGSSNSQPQLSGPQTHFFRTSQIPGPTTVSPLEILEPSFGC